MRALGADQVIDYTREDFLAGPRPYDVIIDIAGNRGLRDLRRALTPRGRLVITGGETSGRWLGGTDRQLRAQLLSPSPASTWEPSSPPNAPTGCAT
ncbi:zinc-binding dehydrogenase [Kitasatospora aburaviensis]